MTTVPATDKINVSWSLVGSRASRWWCCRPPASPTRPPCWPTACWTRRSGWTAACTAGPAVTGQQKWGSEPLLRIRDSSRIPCQKRDGITDLSFLTHIIVVTKLLEIWPGCLMRITDSGPGFLPSRIQGSKKHRIRNTEYLIAQHTKWSKNFFEILILS